MKGPASRGGNTGNTSVIKSGSLNSTTEEKDSEDKFQRMDEGDEIKQAGDDSDQEKKDAVQNVAKDMKDGFDPGQFSNSSDRLLIPFQLQQGTSHVQHRIDAESKQN